MSNKRVLSKVDLGKYKKSNPYSKDIIVDPRGQWDNPGEVTRIPGNNITMQGVDYPVWAQPNIGMPEMMYPNQNYYFPEADYVDEFPQMQEAKQGGALLTQTMTCGNCGWKWKAADGGSDVTTCHKCGGKALPIAQKGITISNPKEYAYRKKMYSDSLDAYEAMNYYKSFFTGQRKNGIPIYNWDGFDGSKIKHTSVKPSSWRKFYVEGQEDKAYGELSNFKKPVQPIYKDGELKNTTVAKPIGTLDPKKSINVNLIKQGFATDTKSANEFKKKLWAELNPDTPYKATDNAAQNNKLNKWIFDNEDKLSVFKETESLAEKKESMPETQELELTPLPTRPLQTRPLVKESTPGTIKPPASTLEWVKHPQTGTWYQIQRPIKPEDLESRKIGFLQDGGESDYYEDDLDETQIEELKAQGYIVEELPKAQKGIEISDPKEYAYRKNMYDDSLNLYKAYIMQDKLMGPGSYKTKDKKKWDTAALKEGRKKTVTPGAEEYGASSRDYQSEYDQFKDGYHWLAARKQDKQLLDYYKKLGFKPNQIMYHASPDIVSDKIKAIGTYFDGNALSPIYKKPVQEVYKDTVPKLETKKLVRQETPDIIPQTLTGIPKSIEALRLAYRNQTVMEPNPNRPGKFKIQKINPLVPYSAYDKDGWQPMNTPTVIYYNPETEEQTPERFKKGGAIEAELTDDEIEQYINDGYTVEEITEYAPGGVVDMNPSTITRYLAELKLQENAGKVGFKNGKFYPHPSAEKGKDTIGYGHKLTGKNDKYYYQGLTPKQVEDLTLKDVLSKQDSAKKDIDAKYGKGTFNSLPQESQMLLTDYQYNVGLSKFPKFLDATVKGDKAGMLAEYERGYKGGKLKKRNAWTEGVINNIDFSKKEKPIKSKTSTKKTSTKKIYTLDPDVYKLNKFTR